MLEKALTIAAWVAGLWLGALLLLCLFILTMYIGSLAYEVFMTQVLGR